MNWIEYFTYRSPSSEGLFPSNKYKCCTQDCHLRNPFLNCVHICNVLQNIFVEFWKSNSNSKLFIQTIFRKIVSQLQSWFCTAYKPTHIHTIQTIRHVSIHLLYVPPSELFRRASYKFLSLGYPLAHELPSPLQRTRHKGTQKMMTSSFGSLYAVSPFHHSTWTK